MRNGFAFIITTMALGLGHPFACNAGERPNVIYVMLDDAGYGDFGAFGSEHVKTPTFDQMCAEGMKFTDHYSGSCVCAPTRCVLMTGLHTGHCRRRDNTAKALTEQLSAKNGRPLVFLEDDDVTVAEALQQAGYVTGGIGKWGLGNPGSDGVPENQGFDYWYGYLDQVHAHDHFPDKIWDGGKISRLHSNTQRRAFLFVFGCHATARQVRDSDRRSGLRDVRTPRWHRPRKRGSPLCRDDHTN